MKHGITLDQVYAAMRAAGREPATREGMQAALQAAGLWGTGNGTARVTIALAAYGLLGAAGSAESDMQRALEAVAELSTPKPGRAEVTIEEVRQALRDWLPVSGGFIKTGDDRVLRLLRERLRLDFTLSGAPGQAGRIDHYLRRRFEGQVSRALNSLAKDGTLRKVGAGTRGPTGQVAGQHEAWFFTPDAWNEAETRTAEHKKATDLAAERTKDITAQLRCLGVPFGTWPDGLPKLEVGAWEDLLELVRSSRRLPTHVTLAHPGAGYEAGREKVLAALATGEVYILKTLRVERSYSTVELLTVDGVPVPGQFGSEFFEIHDPERKS
jgi:hypothetical protein